MSRALPQAADMLGELQEYVESIDMANGKNINQSRHAFTLHTK
ncbi:unnamed protein product [Rhodiola kirilowii]